MVDRSTTKLILEITKRLYDAEQEIDRLKRENDRLRREAAFHRPRVRHVRRSPPRHRSPPRPITDEQDNDVTIDYDGSPVNN